MTEQRVRYETADHVAVLTLDRPQARNAIDPSMSRAIEAGVDAAEADDEVWTVVLASSGPVFCAGADLRSVASGQLAGIETERGGFGGLVRRERTKPMIAAVDGPALAGGFELVLACDLVVASTAASFGLPEVRRALVAIAGGLIRLPRVLPRPVALQLALTGEPITARRAHELGLVAELTEPGEALAGARTLAAAVNRGAPLAVRATRRVLLECAEAPEGEGWAIGRRAMAPLTKTADYAEGPRAFLEKRPPEWTGR